MRRFAGAIAWSLLAALSLLFALRAQADLPCAYVGLYWQTGGVDAGALEGTLRNADTPTRAALWTSAYGQKAKGLFEAKVSVAVCEGDMRLLTGDTLRAGAPGLCAVSEDTAYALYGDKNPLGRALVIEGKECRIGAVFASGQADVLLPWDGTGDFAPTHLALTFPEVQKGLWRGKALSFAENMGAGAPEDALDAALLCALARTDAPLWMIPSKWSDFAAWQKTFDDICARVRAFVMAKQSALDAAVLFAALRALCFKAAFGICLLAALIRLFRSGFGRGIRR